MIKYLATICLCLHVMGVAYCQLDLNFCDPDKIPVDPKNLPIPVINDTARFQMAVEISSGSNTQEIEEFYDGKNKIGLVYEIVGNITFLSYALYDTNELLIVRNSNCFVSKLNESDNMLPFLPSNGNFIPSIYILPSVQAKVVYIGQTGSIRGIPVNSWQTCVFEPRDNSTNKLTFSYSDPTQWTPADYNEEKSHLVEVRIDSKLRNQDEILGSVTTTLVSVLSFRPHLYTRDRSFTTPYGVFCPGRKNTKKIPEIPLSFAFTSQEVVPSQTQLGYGTVAHVYEEYDYANNLFRFDSLGITVIVDFTTGITYLYDVKNRACVRQYENLPLNRDPNTFFQLEGSDYQYIGKRTQNGVYCDVWIVNLGNGTLIEYYFLSDTWQEPSNDAVSSTNPIFVSVINYETSPNNPNRERPVVASHFFGFRRGIANVIDFDFASCKKGLANMFLTFTLSNDNIELKKSLNLFKQATILELKKAARVTLLRISNPLIEFKDDLIKVGFTLYDKWDKYGNVTPPVDDVPLKEAFENLKREFSSKAFTISYTNSTGQMVTYRANINSLSETGSINDATKIQVLTYENGYSAGSIIGLIIVMTIVGMTIGLLLIILHKTRKITLPIVNKYEN